MFADDAVIFVNDPPPRFSDFKTFENTIQQHFGRISEVSFFTSNIQIEVFDKVAFVTSQYLRAYRQNGEMVRENGRWTEVYAQEDGDWKIVHLHSSPDPETLA